MFDFPSPQLFFPPLHQWVYLLWFAMNLGYEDLCLLEKVV